MTEIIFLIISSNLVLSAPVFNSKFGNYLDGPVVANSSVTYFTNGNSLMKYDGTRVTTAHTFPNKVRLSGMSLSQNNSLYLADYRSHKIWKIPYKNGQLQFRSTRSYFHSTKMKQPNDITIASDGTIYAADHPKKATHRGGLWIIPQKSNGQAGTPDFFDIKGVLTGTTVSEDGKNLFVSSSNPCFVNAYSVQNHKPTLK